MELERMYIEFIIKSNVPCKVLPEYLSASLNVSI
jgi:hypothetical protein